VLLPRGTGRRSQGMNHVYVAAQDPHPIDSLFPPNSTSSLPSYHSPTMARGDPWSVLGDRLNLEKQDVQELAARHNQSEIDLPFANRQPSEPEGSWKGEADSMDHHARPQEHAPAPPRIVSMDASTHVYSVARADRLIARNSCRSSVVPWTSATRTCHRI
jgi:hypothetical protein